MLISSAAALAAMAAPPALERVHPPAVEAHLAPLVGDWTREGKEATYRDHCVWYDRRAYVVCSLTDTSSGLRLEAILGYSKEEARFTYQSYSNGGSSETQNGYPLGSDGMVFTDERTIDGKATRLTTSIAPQSDGRIRMSQDRSISGGAWQQVGEVYYIPRNAPSGS
jgi:hypothetical protein